MQSSALAARVSLIVAVAENDVIGRGGALPWRIPSELKEFRRLTMGKPLIMGRRTFASLGRPLDGRDNIVLTGDPDFAPKGVFVARSFEDAVTLARDRARDRNVDEIIVLGGAEVFATALPLANRIYRTIVHARVDGDTVFPPFDPNQWHLVSRAPGSLDPRDEFPWSLEVLERNRGDEQRPGNLIVTSPDPS